MKDKKKKKEKLTKRQIFFILCFHQMTGIVHQSEVPASIAIPIFFSPHYEQSKTSPPHSSQHHKNKKGKCVERHATKKLPHALPFSRCNHSPTISLSFVPAPP